MDETTASKYALQVALQTMKERCQQLQNRLTSVEEENLRLKLENQRFTSSNEETQTRSSLEEQVTQLNKQKASLTHHIFMVANENKQLWTRLSQLTEVNETLGDHLNKISDALNKHTSSAPKPNNSLNLVNKLDKKVTGARDESLEEISLKILNSFKQEKSDLEQQYKEMVELQKIQAELSSCGDFESPVSDVSSDAILAEMKNCKNQLNIMEKTVVNQQRLLLSVLEKIKKKGAQSKGSCPACKERKSQDVSAAVEIPLQHMTDKDFIDESGMVQDTENSGARVCPICARIFKCVDDDGKDFTIFQDHVNEHFIEDDESEVTSILDQFEVLGPH